MQSFSIEIVRQITTVTVKSCEQLAVHLVDPVIYSFPAKAMLFYIISSVIHAFLLVLTYDLLEDRRIDVIKTFFNSLLYKTNRFQVAVSVL